MANVLKIKHDTRTIVMDRAFAKASSIVGSEEYILLQGARRDYPCYVVTTRTIKRNANKECYRGLTYAYMENYIQTHPEAETHMAEYSELRLLAECHSIRYPTIKKWFLETYQEIARYGMEKEPATATGILPLQENVA